MISGSAPFPAAPESILSPVLLGLRRGDLDDPTDAVGQAWEAAAWSIPLTRPVLGVAVGRGKPQQVTHVRRVLVGSSPDHPRLVRLCDVRPGETASDAWGRWQWEVGVRKLDAGSYDSMPTASSVVCLETLSYRISQGRIEQAAQMALFRHMVVAGLRALDPDLIVLGGQYEWNDAWWPEPEGALPS